MGVWGGERGGQKETDDLKDPVASEQECKGNKGIGVDSEREPT